MLVAYWLLAEGRVADWTVACLWVHILLLASVVDGHVVCFDTAELVIDCVNTNSAVTSIWIFIFAHR